MFLCTISSAVWQFQAIMMLVSLLKKTEGEISSIQGTHAHYLCLPWINRSWFPQQCILKYDQGDLFFMLLLPFVSLQWASVASMNILSLIILLTRKSVNQSVFCSVFRELIFQDPSCWPVKKSPVKDTWEEILS